MIFRFGIPDQVLTLGCVQHFDWGPEGSYLTLIPTTISMEGDATIPGRLFDWAVQAMTTQNHIPFIPPRGRCVPILITAVEMVSGDRVKVTLVRAGGAKIFYTNLRDREYDL